MSWSKKKQKQFILSIFIMTLQESYFLGCLADSQTSWQTSCRLILWRLKRYPECFQCFQCFQRLRWALCAVTLSERPSSNKEPLFRYQLCPAQVIRSECKITQDATLVQKQVWWRLNAGFTCSGRSNLNRHFYQNEHTTQLNEQVLC